MNLEKSGRKMIEKIQRLMDEKGASIDDIVANTIIKKTTMKRYMSGDIGKMKTSEISSLAEYFNVSPAYLMGWEDYRVLEYILKDGETFMYKNLNRKDADEQFIKEIIGKEILEVKEID